MAGKTEESKMISTERCKKIGRLNGPKQFKNGGNFGTLNLKSLENFFFSNPKIPKSLLFGNLPDEHANQISELLHVFFQKVNKLSKK